MWEGKKGKGKERRRRGREGREGKGRGKDDSWSLGGSTPLCSRPMAFVRHRDRRL